MKNSFYFKLATIFALIIALMIPRSFLSDIINERLGWREQAYTSIGQSWPGEQTLAGPVLVVPYKLTYNVKEKIIDVDKTNKQVTKNEKLSNTETIQKEIIKEVTFEDRLYIIPKQLSVNGKVDSSMRYRGIYGIPIYNSALEIKGEFSFKPIADLIERNKGVKLDWGKPYLSVLVNDQRGIAAPPVLKWGSDKITFQPGTGLSGAETGMLATLPVINLEQNQSLPFAFSMELKGMRSINFAPLSDDTVITLTSNWASPSFTGQLLPDTRDVTEQGFSAKWQASSFSYNISGVMEACRKGDCLRLKEKAVGFELIQPVDVYQQSERSIKYAFLFITLTFVVLILLELLKKLRIHPIQYSLVGMALLVFYLLLISLSEHISFLYAYSIGAVASTALLTLYFGGILRSHKLGLMLGSGLSVLYSLLYVILQAEETALLMGSVLIFAVLSILMLLTRHLDWYALTGQSETSSQAN
jgi:inner membrane protein